MLRRSAEPEGEGLMPSSSFAIVWLSSPEDRFQEAVVPHLDPLIRAAQSGRDGLVRLPDGRTIRPSWLQAVAEYDGACLRAAWTVRDCGLDGQHSWPEAWRAVAAATGGITADDPRLPAVQAVLDQLDAAYAARDVLHWLAGRAALDRALAAGQEVACIASRK